MPLPPSGVYTWHQFLDVFHDDSIEQRHITILKAGEKDVFLQIGGLASNVSEDPHHLPLDGRDTGRQKASNPQCSAFRFGEGGSLVECRVSEYCNTEEVVVNISLDDARACSSRGWRESSIREACSCGG